MALKPIAIEVQADVTGQDDVRGLARQLENLADTLDGDLKVQALASAQALRELGAKQGAIDAFVRLKAEAADAAARLRESQTAAQQFGQAMAASAAPTRTQVAQMEKLRDAVRTAKTELQGKTRALDNSRDVLRAYNVTSTNLADSERAVRKAISETRSELTKLPPAIAAAKAATEARAAADRKAAEEAVALAARRAAAEKEAAQAQIAAQRQAAADAKASAREQAAAAREAMRVQAEQAKAAKAALSGIGDTLRAVQRIALTALGGSLLAGVARDVSAIADEYNNLRARLSLVAGEGPALEAALEGVRKVALGTNSELTATGTLFARIAQSGKEMGISQQQALDLTRLINQATQTAGGSAESAQAAITQLIQGIQSGVLRGEEFNSVMEQASPLADALARALGKTKGELRAMAQEGRITTEVLLTALLGQKDAIQEAFDKLPMTVGRSLQNLSTNWTTYIGEVDRATGASQAAANAINAVGENLDEIGAIAVRAGSVLTAVLAVQAAAAFRTYVAEAAAARAATVALGGSVAAIPKTVQISVAVVGLEAGYQLGSWMYENSETLKKLGAGMVDYVAKNVNSLKFLKEAAAAVFSDDTIEAALDRYNQRAAEQRDIISAMMADAKKAPEAVEQAAKRATDAILESEQAVKKYGVTTGITAADIVAAWEAQRVAKVGDAQAAEANLRVQLQLAQQSEQMARYLGNEYQVRKARIRQYELEIQIAEARNAVARAEAEGTIAVAQAKLAEMQASKNADLVKQAELETAIKLARAKLAEADATSKATEFMKRQLTDFKNGVNDGEAFGRTLDTLSSKQAGFATDTNRATQAVEKQSAAMDAINKRYASPLGPNKYTRPEGASIVGSAREERLAGQNAVDNTTMFALREKLQRGLLTVDDLPALQGVLQANVTNGQIARDMSPGSWSLAGAADWQAWQNTMKLFEQAVARLGNPGTAGTTTEIRKRVDMRVRTDNDAYEFSTDERGEKEMQRLFIEELRRGKKRSARR